MASYVLTNSQVVLNDLDVSGQTNNAVVQYGAEEKEASVYGDTFVRRIPGLRMGSVSASGYHNLGTNEQDDEMFSGLGVADRIVTVAAEGGAVGNVAYSFKTLESSYEVGGDHGEVAPYSMSGSTSGHFTRGKVLHATSTARTATGNGTATNLGAVTSAQALHVALHVVAASGTTPTLTVTIESDDDSGFASPVTRASFTQATATTAEYLVVTGAVTDTWWRAKYTIGGTSPSFAFLVNAGIQ